MSNSSAYACCGSKDKDGKPLYVFGPYDDHRSVIRTLKRTVGRGNFEVLAITG